MELLCSYCFMLFSQVLPIYGDHPFFTQPLADNLVFLFDMVLIVMGEAQGVVEFVGFLSN